jgi:cob(I)alamin adenosyltransferase
MGHRLTRIYTRTGDNGTTALADGKRIAKTEPRIEAIGAVDELNSLVGLVNSESLPGDIAGLLTRIQHQLFNLGGELASPGRPLITAMHVQQLENNLDELNAALPPLKDFVLPGGSRAASFCHLARAVCRRAERRIISLSRHDAVRPDLLRYLNRLSDLLFVIARALNRAADHDEILWNNRDAE